MRDDSTRNTASVMRARDNSSVPFRAAGDSSQPPWTSSSPASSCSGVCRPLVQCSSNLAAGPHRGDFEVAYKPHRMRRRRRRQLEAEIPDTGARRTYQSPGGPTRPAQRPPQRLFRSVAGLAAHATAVAVAVLQNMCLYYFLLAGCLTPARSAPPDVDPPAGNLQH